MCFNLIFRAYLHRHVNSSGDKLPGNHTEERAVSTSYRDLFSSCSIRAHHDHSTNTFMPSWIAPTQQLVPHHGPVSGPTCGPLSAQLFPISIVLSSSTIKPGRLATHLSSPRPAQSSSVATPSKRFIAISKIHISDSNPHMARIL